MQEKRISDETKDLIINTLIDDQVLESMIRIMGEFLYLTWCAEDEVYLKVIKKTKLIQPLESFILKNINPQLKNTHQKISEKEVKPMIKNMTAFLTDENLRKLIVQKILLSNKTVNKFLGYFLSPDVTYLDFLTTVTQKTKNALSALDNHHKYKSLPIKKSYLYELTQQRFSFIKDFFVDILNHKKKGGSNSFAAKILRKYSTARYYFEDPNYYIKFNADRQKTLAIPFLLVFLACYYWVIVRLPPEQFMIGLVCSIFIPFFLAVQASKYFAVLSLDKFVESYASIDTSLMTYLKDQILNALENLKEIDINNREFPKKSKISKNSKKILYKENTSESPEIKPASGFIIEYSKPKEHQLFLNLKKLKPKEISFNVN